MRTGDPTTCDHELRFWWQPYRDRTILLCACGERSTDAPPTYKPTRGTHYTTRPADPPAPAPPLT